MSWRPTADLAHLEARATLVAGLRRLMHEAGSLEVEVPAIAAAPASDPWIDCFAVVDPAGAPQGFLLSSPETYLKRLLAAHRCPLHAFVKAYRANEQGRQHAVEFSMLEWYRPVQETPFQSMLTEIEQLVMALTDLGRPRVVSYRQLFERVYGLNPHQATEAALKPLAADLVGSKTAQALDLDSLLNLLFASGIEPLLSNHLVIDFPSIAAALSVIAPDDQGDPVAKRAELYLNGVEIANGYQELTDATEQARRFAEDARRRLALGRPAVPVDQALLEALQSGLPESYGVALGVDRLVMVALGETALSSCMSFWEP